MYRNYMREILCYYYCNYKHTHVHHRVCLTPILTRETRPMKEREKKKRKKSSHQQEHATTMMLLRRLFIFLACISAASAVRVAFIADTGIGNDNPSSSWVDYRGNVQGSPYKINGRNCYDHAGQPCKLYSRARDVVRLAKESGADLIVHAGDLDYESAPKMWVEFLKETVRDKVEYIAAKGNHDADGWDGVRYLWSGSEGYQKLLEDYGVPRGAKCKGQYGVDMSCEYKGILFVLSSVGVERAGESNQMNQDHYWHLENSLKNSNARWKICVWHMTMEKMQVSYKGDSTGWGAYEICRKYGAFIVGGHAHVYSRTREMSRFGTKNYGFTREDLKWWDAPDDDRIYLSSGENGTTGVAIVGIGGYKNEACLNGGNFWSKIYSTRCDDCSQCVTARSANKFGTLICDFPEFGPNARATCWLATTPRQGASDAEFQAAVRNRNPVDKFTLIAGKRSKDKGVSSSAAPDESDTSRPFLNRNLLRVMMDCFDIEPRDQYNCIDRANWNQCNDAWIVSGNYCAKSCKRCGPESVEQPAPRKSREEELALDQAFSQFDANRDGFIDFDEWEMLYYSTRPGAKDDEIERVERVEAQFVRADSNGDGKVSRGRFAVLLDGQEQKQK